MAGHDIGKCPYRYRLAARSALPPPRIVVQPASYYTSDGDVPCIRGFNIRPGGVSNEDLVYISQASNAQLRKSMESQPAQGSPRSHLTQPKA